MRNSVSNTRVITGLLLSITKVRDARIVNVVIPAAFSPRESGEGIHCLLTDPDGPR
jgi:hypothetical protein